MPVCIMRAMSYFGYGKLSTVTFSYVSVPLIDMQHFLNHAMARIVVFEHLRLINVGAAGINQNTFSVSFYVSKLSFTGMELDLVASIIHGCKEQHSLFIDLETSMLGDTLWRNVRGSFNKTEILQLNSGRFLPGVSFDDLLYRQGDYNRLVDFRISGVFIAPA